MDQIERIMHMEEILDEAADVFAVLSKALERYCAVQKRLEELTAYYSGGQWQRDFDDDGAGRIPKDLKRGVLSEDAVYDLLLEDAWLREQFRRLGSRGGERGGSPELEADEATSGGDADGPPAR